MAVTELASSLFPFAFVDALLWLGWRQLSRRASDSDARAESRQRLRRLRFNGWFLAGVVTVVVAAMTGFGRPLGAAVMLDPTLGVLLPPWVARWGAVAYGPLLVATAAVHDAVAPYRDALRQDPRSRVASLRRFLWWYLRVTLPLFGLGVLVHWTGGGLPAALVVAAAVLAVDAAKPAVVRVLDDARAPTAAERDALDGVEGLDDVGLQVIETPDVEAAQAVAAGVVPGFRTVFVTDDLLAELSTGEARAVLAHEYAHLRRHHPLQVTVLRAGSLGVAVWAATGAVAAPGALLAPGPVMAAAAGVLLYFGAIGALRRRQEFAADRAAADRVGATRLATALTSLAASVEATRPAESRGGVTVSPRVDDRIRRLDPSVLRDRPAIPTRT